MILGEDARDDVVERIRARTQMREDIRCRPHVEHWLAAQPRRGQPCDRRRDAPRMLVKLRDRLLDRQLRSRYALAPV
jgi:hypothetical protein